MFFSTESVDINLVVYLFLSFNSFKYFTSPETLYKSTFHGSKVDRFRVKGGQIQGQKVDRFRV